jgi:hypothetical protein
MCSRLGLGRTVHIKRLAEKGVSKIPERVVDGISYPYQEASPERSSCRMQFLPMPTQRDIQVREAGLSEVVVDIGEDAKNWH